MAPAGEGAEANREKSCAICAVGFGASVWRYHCTDCRHSFCSSHCKDLWALDDDVEEGEEDPFTVLKQDAAEDPPPELVERDESESDFELDSWARWDQPSDFVEYFDLIENGVSHAG